MLACSLITDKQLNAVDPHAILVQWILQSEAVCASNQISDRGGPSNVINLGTVNSVIDANSIRSTLNTNAITTTTGRCGFIANILHGSKQTETLCNKNGVQN